MKVFTFRLGQFAIGVLFLTVLFRYILNLCVGMGNVQGALACSIVYFALVFFAGIFYGEKDVAESGIYDFGFRFHLVAYFLFVIISIVTYQIGWYAESLKAMVITALIWGIALVAHFTFFLVEEEKDEKWMYQE